MRIIANTHRKGSRPIQERKIHTFEVRLYATSDIIGDVTVIETIPSFNVNSDPYRALCLTLERFADAVVELTNEGENCGDIKITRATVCHLLNDNSKRHLCYHSIEEPDEVFYNMLCMAMYKHTGE